MIRLRGRVLRQSALAALIVLLAAGCALAQSQGAATKQSEKKSEYNVKSDLPNFYRVDDNYFRGGQPTEAGMRRLSELGVKTVIDLRDDRGDRDDWEKDLSEKLGMSYFNISISTFRSPDEEQIARLMAILHNKEKSPVYVHCLLGNDRTGLATGLYRLEFYDWTPDQAYKEMKETGFSVPFLRRGMKSYLYKYAKRKSNVN